MARDVGRHRAPGLMSWRSAEPVRARRGSRRSYAARAPPRRVTDESAPLALRSADEGRRTKHRVRQVEALPIPDYDELSASQVVERLEGLDATRSTRSAPTRASHRGRNTILGKIAQLG